MGALDGKDLVSIAEVVGAFDEHGRVGRDVEVELEDMLVRQLARTEAGDVVGHVDGIAVPVMGLVSYPVHHSPILMGSTLT